MDSKCHPEGQRGFQQQVPCVGLISGDIFGKMMDGCKRCLFFCYSFISFEQVHVSCFDVKSIYFLIRYFWEGLGVVGSKEGLVAKDSTNSVNSLAFQTFNPSL